ncbi:MAG TPA: energy transducer TonB [Daejeonella sp.]|nr:energy transducer TonB [Daejeonella sp.]
MPLNFILILLLSIPALAQTGQPTFKGGTRNLENFITTNLIYPEYAKQNCLQGIVNVSFKLNKQGKIVDSEVQNGSGIDLDLEALRVVRLSSGKWVVPPDYDTTVAVVLPVNFSLKDYQCEQRSKDDINAAIAAYHARQDLSKAIYNYYEKRDQGHYYPEEEGRILALKSQLGYDEKYIDRLLRQALRKLKQGDQESACDDFHTIHNLGSNKADSWISKTCK